MRARLLRRDGRDRLRGLGRYAEFRRDPAVGRHKPFREQDARLPPQDFPQPSIVAVAPTHALGARQVMALGEVLAGDVADEIDEAVDGDQLVRPEVQRFMVAGFHDPIDALNAIVDMHERACLKAVAPDLDLATVRLRATLRQIAAGAFSLPPS